MSKNLENLVGQLESISKQFWNTHSEIINAIHASQFINHPVVLRISGFLNLNYGIWFDDFDKLNALLLEHRWEFEDDDEQFYRWSTNTSIENSKEVISVAKSLFNENKQLRNPAPSSIDDEVTKKTEEYKVDDVNEDELPF